MVKIENPYMEGLILKDGSFAKALPMSEELAD